MFEMCLISVNLIHEKVLIAYKRIFHENMYILVQKKRVRKYLPNEKLELAIGIFSQFIYKCFVIPFN